MDSILVVCYSYSGVTRRAAQLIASHHGWPLAEIRDRRPGRDWWRCVFDSLLRRHPRIDYDGPSPGDFRTVVLMAPIWAWRLAGPMRSFIAAHRESLSRFAMVTTMGSGGASNAVGEASRILGHAPIATVAFTQRALEDGSATARLLAFGDDLLPPSTAARTTQSAAISRPAVPGPAAGAH
ncbi:MAG TPA: flavodoxin [Ramlibacter sp.]|uniref:flavodoxin family protein n=1 Tax=Ramlibacter sp. TaxID=1917967 RepID=UPI002C239878|nr:flavodoxin [Ramlibacter sp.]HVZ42852.1 flavodoxin [Ramlibacter sp.]